MNQLIKSTASRYGLIVAGIGIAFTLVAYLVNLKLFVNPVAGIGIWVVNLVLLILAVAAVKKQQGGFIEFKEAFTTFIVTFVISSLISTVFSLLLFTVIDPQASEKLQEMIIESTVSMMERFNTPDAQIEKQIEAMEGNNQFSVINQVKGFFMGVVIYAIIGMIVAAAMKKKKPEYPADTTDSEI